MLNEKIRISVTDLPTRPSRPTDEELEQIFGGFNFFSWLGGKVRKSGEKIATFFRGW
jgi:hypothetical protein